MSKVAWTVEDFEKGITKAINGNGEVVEVFEVTDRLLRVQGIRFGYTKGTFLGRTNTYVNNDGKLLAGYDTVLDLFKIE